MKRLIKNQVTDRVVMLGDWIPLRMARAPVTAANYNYVNASRVPAHGEITTTGVQLRINNVDSDGVDHGAYLSHVKNGDIVVSSWLRVDIAAFAHYFTHIRTFTGVINVSGKRFS